MVAIRDVEKGGTQMAEMDEDLVARLVDDQLRFVRGEGPEPDLSGLSERDRSEIVEVLNLVDALADSRPVSPPIEEDPIAIRLGLVPAKTGASSNELDDPSQPADPIVVSTEELRYRFAGAVEVEQVESVGEGDRWTPVALCRTLAENVLVVRFQPSIRTPSAIDARPLLRDDTSLTAVTFCSPDATRAAVVVASSAFGRFVPSEGWRQPDELTWNPLGIALGSYLDRSMPNWDAVSSLPREDLLDELGADTVAEVSDVFTTVAASRPNLEHKRQARDFVADVDPAVVVAWADDIRAGRKAAEDVVSAIAAMCQEAAP
jgi:hypothetical protein